MKIWVKSEINKVIIFTCISGLFPKKITDKHCIKKLLHLICLNDDYFKDLRITITFSALNFADDFALDPDGTSVWDLEAVAAKWKLEKLSLKKEYFNMLKT